MAALVTALLLMALATGQLASAQYYPGLPAYHRFGPKRLSSTRTGDHEACAARCPPQPGQYNQEFMDAAAAVNGNNATDAQVESFLTGICSQQNTTLTCLENAAKECDVGYVPMYSGQLRFFRSFCEDGQRTAHYRKLHACDKFNMGQLFDESMEELVPSNNTQAVDELHHDAAKTESVTCSATGKLREKIQAKNVEQLCGADSVPVYNSLLDKLTTAFCRTGNGGARLTFGGLFVFVVLLVFLPNSN